MTSLGPSCFRGKDDTVNTHHSDYAIDVRSCGTFLPGVLDRAKAMLEAALLEAVAEHGAYRFDVDGPCEALKQHSLPVLEVQPSVQVPIVIVVRLKSSRNPESTIKGSLRLPPGVNRGELFKNLVPALANFNAEGWRSVLENISPGPPTDKRAPLAIRQEEQPRKLLPSAITSVPATLESSRTQGQAVPKREAAVPDSKTDRNDKLAEFLRGVLAQDGVANGVFTGKGVTKYSQPLFPHEAMIWQRTGILRELTGLHWIRRVGHGEYQVEQAFAMKHELAIPLTPRDKIARGNKKKDQPKNEPKPNGHTLGVGGLQALLDQAAALKVRIQEEVRLEQQSLEASLAEAQAQVVERQAALDAFKARFISIASPDETVSSVPAAGR